MKVCWYHIQTEITAEAITWCLRLGPSAKRSDFQITPKILPKYWPREWQVRVWKNSDGASSPGTLSHVMYTTFWASFTAGWKLFGLSENYCFEKNVILAISARSKIDHLKNNNEGRLYGCPAGCELPQHGWHTMPVLTGQTVFFVGVWLCSKSVLVL